MGKSPDRNWTFATAFKQLKYCGYMTKYEKHDLEMNDAYIYG